VIQTYVEFLFPGAFVSESNTEKVESRDAEIVLPRGAFGWRFFERQEWDTGEEVLRGAARNHGPWTFVGDVLTLDEVRAQLPDKHILITNMEVNGIERVVYTKAGQFIPMDEVDRAIAP
jgi:hypothetical protein